MKLIFLTCLIFKISFLCAQNVCLLDANRDTVISDNIYFKVDHSSRCKIIYISDDNNDYLSIQKWFARNIKIQERFSGLRKINLGIYFNTDTEEIEIRLLMYSELTLQSENLKLLESKARLFLNQYFSDKNVKGMFFIRCDLLMNMPLSVKE